MKIISARQRDWLIAVGYVILIYATLEVARLPLAFLRARGCLRISLAILFISAAAAIVTIVARERPFKFWKFPLLIGVGFVYYVAVKRVQTPEEQIHFFEYGLVGIFFLRAIQHQTGPAWRSWFYALLFATLAGWLDEILQGLSPHRHYDVRDVALNAVSAFLGLGVYLIYRLPNSHR